MKSYIPLIVACILAIVVGFLLSAAFGTAFLVVGCFLYWVNITGMENEKVAALNQNVDAARTLVEAMRQEVLELRTRVKWLENNVDEKTLPFGR